MTRTPLRPLARILDARAKGENPDAIERENLRLRHEAMRDRARNRAEGRLLVVGIFFLCAFVLVGGRMGTLANAAVEEPRDTVAGASIIAQRADITDRNGRILATNLTTHALYAQPPLMVDKPRAARELARIFPDLDEAKLLEQFSGSRKFMWIKRRMSPEQQQAVHDIGDPGLLFGPREMRLYPNGTLASHILGGASFGREGVDSAEVIGVAGVEKTFDDYLRDPANDGRPLELSIDLSVQAVVEQVLAGGMRLMSAKGATAILMDAHTGEIISMASLPDFDPNDRPPLPTSGDPSDSPLFNRAVQGVYELGSTFKIFPVAQAIELGVVTPSTIIDTKGPMRWGRFRISDFRNYGDQLTVEQVIVKSSNIGTARIAAMMGIQKQQEFLGRLGFLEPTPVELVEAPNAKPLIPKNWSELSMLTISYGHGLSASPLHLATAYATITNGGMRVRPTLIKRQGMEPGEQIISPRTSAIAREMLRKTVTEGTATLGDVEGYEVAGKTGTADKPRRTGGYYDDKVITTFASVFPASDPSTSSSSPWTSQWTRWGPSRAGRRAGRPCRWGPRSSGVSRRSWASRRPLNRTRSLGYHFPLTRTRVGASMGTRAEGKKLSELGLAASGQRDVRVTGLAVDSREVRDGFLFAALPGSRLHGGEFIQYSLRMGAGAILTDREGARIAAGEIAESGVPVVLADDPRQALSYAAALWFGLQPDTVVAVTGTNGKTSVATFTRQLWQAMGMPAVNIGTTGVVGDISLPLIHTTPEPITLHRALCEVAEAGIEHAAMEASSHGLDQRRLDGVRLVAAGFTNFSQDHLDYHGTMEAYFAAKAQLFDRLLPEDGTAVVNLDDPKGPEVAAIAEARGCDLLTVGRAEGAALRILGQRFDVTGQVLRFAWNGVARQVRLDLVGGFQAENALVAAGLCIASGSAPGEVFEAMSRLTTVPGRMQLAATRANGAAVFVDYAHTPDALRTAISALRPHVMGRLVVVFGAGGDRDRGKRPKMGRAVADLADVAIVTDDNPRSEDPATIRAMVLEGCPEAAEVADRAEAILRGVDALEPGDALLIAGKGHETGQTVGSTVYPFDDVEQASVAVAALDGRVA